MSDATFALIMLVIAVPLIFFAVRHNLRSLKHNLGVIKQELTRDRNSTEVDPLAKVFSPVQLAKYRANTASQAGFGKKQAAEAMEFDLRPRNPDGSIMETMPRSPVADNPDHPSYAYHEAIDLKLAQPGLGIADLDVAERNFYLAYGFDSYAMNDGLETRLDVYPDPVLWQQALDALYIVGADEYHAVFKRFLEIDGDSYAQAIVEGREQEYAWTEDWDAHLRYVRDNADEGEPMLYMERRLDAFCAE